MFESFKLRKEELPMLEFENWKVEDLEMQELTIEVTSKMTWEVEDGEDGEQTAVSFEPEEGYKESLRNLQKHLDKKNLRFSERAIAITLAKIMDVGDCGYAETLN